MSTETAVMEMERGTAKKLTVEFLYLDLNTCSRCVDTGKNLDQALKIVSEALDATGIKVAFQKILVESQEQAMQLHFVSSPTVRLNGHDLALEVKESNCGDCSDLGDSQTNCRVWSYQGQEYTEAPVGLLVEAILGEIYGGLSRPNARTDTGYQMPENLSRFFEGKAQKESTELAVVSSCCSATKQSTCCAPSEKSSCCGTGGASTCGCQS